MNTEKYTERPLILVTNDDGIHAKGIHALIDFLLPLGDVICIAPDGPRSAQSMALTIAHPLRLTPHPDYHGAKMFSVNGTPVDCIKLSNHYGLPRKPDYLASGINHGSNSSVNVLYSGTMGAVMEGCALGIPSVGFSLTSHNPDADFSGCEETVRKISEEVLLHGLPEGICLNVNVPDGVVPKGIRITRAAKGNWSDEYQRYTDPSGHDFFMLTGKFVNAEPDCDETDEWALKNEFVSVSPIEVDRTSSRIPDWLSKLV